MPNNLTQIFQTKVVPGLVKHMQYGLTTAWMESNAVGVDYKGGKYIVMSDIDTDGLGNYDRQNGFPKGYVTGSKQTFEMTQDRGREFLIDAADNDETGFLYSAANVMKRFQEKYVIPEIDTYRYSQIFAQVKAKASSNVKAPIEDTADLTDALLADIATVRDSVGDVPLVVVMSGLTQAKFGKDFTRTLEYVSFQNGAIYTKLKSVDSTPIMIAPSSRLVTSMTMKDGTSSSQEAGGFTPGSSKIQWAILPKNGPIAVAKIDKIRVFTPDEYQDAYAWKTDYRIWHDIWVPQEAADHSLIRADGEV